MDPLEQRRQQWQREAEAEVAARQPAPGPDLSNMSASEMAGAVNPNVTPSVAGPVAALPGPDPAAVKAASPHAPQPLASGMPQPPTPPGLGGTIYETTTNRTTGSSGLSADAQARANVRLDKVGQANETAVGAEADARQARADYEVHATEQALSDVAQRRREAAAEQTLNDHIQADVDRRMQAAADWKPERKNMLGFGAGRGLAAAVAVIAGGWMQGRGQTSTNQFLPFVMKMIDDDVNDQVRKNSANIQFLREQKGDIKAAAAELKKRQLMLVDAELQAKSAAAAAKDPSVQKAIEAYKSASAAKQAEWDAEQRKSLERTVTEQVSRVTSPVAVGAPKTNQATMNLDSNISELQGVLDDVEGTSDDDLGTVVGYGAVKPLGVLPSDNDMKRFLGLMPEGQTRALNAINRYQRIAYMAMTREPNGQLAGVLAKIGVPQSDSEIPEWKRTLKRELHNMKSVRQGAAGGVEDPSRGTF